MTNILVAYGQRREIGQNNELPWGSRGLPTDLRRFKELTLGTSVIMGRSTWESIPPRFRPLPGRENIVLSRNPAFHIEDVLCVNSLAKAIKSASAEPFIIGGAEVYKEALALTDRIYATEVQDVFPDADRFFPEIAPAKWQEMSREPHPLSDDTPDTFGFDFVIYERQK